MRHINRRVPSVLFLALLLKSFFFLHLSCVASNRCGTATLRRVGFSQWPWFLTVNAIEKQHIEKCACEWCHLLLLMQLSVRRVCARDYSSQVCVTAPSMHQTDTVRMVGFACAASRSLYIRHNEEYVRQTECLRRNGRQKKIDYISIKCRDCCVGNDKSCRAGRMQRNECMRTNSSEPFSNASIHHFD